MPRLALLLVALLPLPALAQYHRIDLAEIPTDTGELLRAYGSVGNGAFGVPVAGGKDCDGDGIADYAFAAMLASPLGRDRAGLIHLVFGDGQTSGTVDTAVAQPRLLEIAGSGKQETAGNEMWMDDVTGDGIADLLIGRQNFSFTPALAGDGALTILVGGPGLKALASGSGMLDLRQPPFDLAIVTVFGGQRGGRLGMWMRTGDLDGDGIADIVVGADQEDHVGQTHSGSVYLIRGGAHLAFSQLVSLDPLGDSPLAGQVARIDPPALAHLHFGSTCQLLDLDHDGRSEILVGAALNRAGGVLSPSGAGSASSDGFGGTAHGTLYIVWDESIPAAPWPADFHFTIDAAVPRASIIQGGERNAKLGEEIAGGVDYDADGRTDLFVGDLSADLSPNRNRPDSGAGYIFYDAALLRGRRFVLDDPPAGVRITAISGEIRGAITGDTAIDGDFDGDGIADLALGSPHAAPLDRQDAGILHVLFGRPGGWPAVVDVTQLASSSEIRATEVLGARGQTALNDGDVLGYSVAAGDLNGDGRTDLVINEMEGDGVGPKAIDVGNLLAIDGSLLASGEDLVECAAAPLEGCQDTMTSFLQLNHGREPDRRRLRWRWRGDSLPVPGGESGDDGYALCVYDASSPRPVVALSLRSPRACPSCWQQVTNEVWRYLDRAPSTDGIDHLRWRIGSPARLALRSRGWTSATSEGRLAVPVTVQLVAGRGAATTCWQSRYALDPAPASTRFSSRSLPTNP